MFFFVLISRKYFKICQKKKIDNVTVKKSGNSFAQETKIDIQGFVKSIQNRQNECCSRGDGGSRLSFHFLIYSVTSIELLFYKSSNNKCCYIIFYSMNINRTFLSCLRRSMRFYNFRGTRPLRLALL